MENTQRTGKVSNFDYKEFWNRYKLFIIIALVVAVTAVILCIVLIPRGGDTLIPRGGDTKDIKNTTAEAYVEKYVDAAKKTAQGNPEAPTAVIPEVTEKEEPKYNTTTLTYGDKAVIEVYSNKETNAVNGSNLRVYSPAATRKEDEAYFFAQVKVMIKNSDPSASRNQIDSLVELFRAALPDPEAEGYTGFSARTETLHDISYMAFYDYSVEPATLELLVS